jgi:hypothetical protein
MCISAFEYQDADPRIFVGGIFKLGHAAAFFLRNPTNFAGWLLDSKSRQTWQTEFFQIFFTCSIFGYKAVSEYKMHIDRERTSQVEGEGLPWVFLHTVARMCATLSALPRAV